MAGPLVIVESPAKARTISGFLGAGYTVMASMGHIRDLPTKGLSVDVDNGFKVDYEVHASKKQVIADLKAALKDADELYLATDEDREGEAISWHLLEVLNPRVPVKRMVFHEITSTAIEHAIENSRDVDYGLVDAQESRRIVDRLFGYPVSEVCWRKVRPRLSAGRVQSPAVRLVVDRERERMRFVTAAYWDIEAAFPTSPAFAASLSTVEGKRVAAGKDFTPDGRASSDDLAILDEDAARGIAQRLDGAAFTVAGIEESPYRSRPKPPFITSSLQQVGGSRLRMTARQVMQTAQGLYERGYITYMRTDSTTLSNDAISAARTQIESLYGREYLLDAPRTYTKKAKNAQEAHEAIRPAGDSWRTPDQLRSELRGDDLRLYELVWQRTLASQMPDATGRTVSLTIAATSSAQEQTTWSASGTTITFPGYRRVYGFGESDTDAAADDTDAAVLPDLAVDDALPDPTLEPKGHATQPPARYTEATLVKALEDNGIGRPSTYASIMERIQDNYVWKKGQALVPNTDAFAVTNLLTDHFTALVDYDFTARMEDDLDEIAGGREQRIPWLTKFWFGNGTPGLATLKEQALEQADPAAINTVATYDIDGRVVELRNGRYGPFLRDGDESRSLPEGLALDELDEERVRKLLAAPKGDEPIGTDPASELPVFAKNGRYGPYVQLGDSETLPANEKPKMASLFKDMDLSTITVDDALKLLSLPRSVGEHPNGGEIQAANGRYGPYLKWGEETRSLQSEEQLFTVALDEAIAILAQPKTYGRARSGPALPLKEFPPDPVSGNPIQLRDGRYGPYVTDGIDNQSLKKGDEIEELTHERAVELLAQRREYLEANPQAAKRAAKKRAGGAKKAAKRSAKKATKKAAKKATKKPAARVSDNGAASAPDDLDGAPLPEPPDDTT
jgi:DNA topoisomerase-1